MSLAALEQAGLLSALDVELANALARVSGERDPLVLLAAALTSREVQSGHVCLELSQWADRPEELRESPELAPFAWPAREAWLSALARSALVSRAELSEARPLVLDEKGRLYLARYYEHETALAARLREIASAPPDLNAPDPALVERLFPSSPAGERDLQREAAVASQTRKLSVIVGGPGTGKTSTVVKLLALLVATAQRREQPTPRIVLAAPTGKAAQRLGEAIEKARDKLPVDEALKQAIPHKALTVHRALGPIYGSSTRFRHHREHPIDCDVLLLDEASMVDLALMRRLLDAVPPHARVILLGDPDQLVSVEAGGVLTDLCAAAARPESPMGACLSRLTRSYRYQEGSGIAALARAVHTQDAEAALDVLRSGAPDVTFCAVAASKGLPRPLAKEASQQYAGLHKPQLEARLAALDTYRILCAHRRGPEGVEQLNLALARSLTGRVRGAHESYAGRPIIVLQNDYGSQLFNGDVGVLHTARRGGLTAHFRTGPEHVRSVSLSRLPRHESVYAMTVHKSQGSEFEQVAIVLPERPSPILTRELLYTAITRAKRAVSVYASESVLRTAIEQRTRRASGLSERLA